MARMAGRWRHMVAVARLTAASLVAAAPAHAVVPACGSTITSDTTLAADLSCPGDGLVIGASKVVLDLGGHTVDGRGTAFGAGSLGTGVRLSPWASGVTVKNGRVGRFRTGVAVPAGADAAELAALAVTDNAFGVVVSSNHTRVRSNVMLGNGVEVNVNDHGNEVVGNRLHANSAGIIAPMATGVRIVGNSIVGDGKHDAGVTVFGSRGVRVSGNSISESLEGKGIWVRFSEGVDVTGNQVFRNGDGIAVDGSSVRISSNVAFQNLDLGIEASGASDGGGNRAFGNGNPLQCVGVACR